MKFIFQGLLYKKNNTINGPMSPLLAAKEIAKVFNIRINGLVRLKNSQAQYGTFDHLIIKSIYKNGNVYAFFVDKGINLLPVALWFEEDNSLTITPIYKKEILPDNRILQLLDMEQNKKSSDNPIIQLTDVEFIELFKQASKSNEFKIKEYE